jgi:cold shock CspA family protein
MEVEFFVIAEMIKGKFCDRAMHLKPIPKGTVQLEVLFAKEVMVTVTKVPGNNESPGAALLAVALDSSALFSSGTVSHITEVDIWQRCLPDNLTVNIGDQLFVDIHYYRPEKLFFVRSVKVHQYFPLGRDTGVISAVKETGSFGFLSSENRKIDLYFRTNNVIDDTGVVLSTLPLVGQRVSFDVMGSDSSSKLRAVRVQLLGESDKKARANDDESLILRKDVRGVVVRTAGPKKDASGLILVDEQLWRDIQALQFVDTRYDEELQLFLDTPGLKTLDLFALPTFLLKLYVAAAEKKKEHIKYETISVPGEQWKNLKIWKEEQVAERGLDAVTALLTNSTLNRLPPSMSSLGNTSSELLGSNSNTLGLQSPVTIPALLPADLPPTPPVSNNSRTPKDGFTIPYVRDSVDHEDASSLVNDMEVIFHICWDRTQRRRIAKHICITDEPIPGEAERIRGVVEVVFERSDRFGFIRTIPNDEKLFFHANSLGKGSPASTLQQGKPVSLIIRRRGGLRWATDVCPCQAPLQCQRLMETCVALAVDGGHGVLVEVPEDNLLSDRIIPVGWYTEAMQSAQGNKEWIKQSLVSSDESVVVSSVECKEETGAAVATLASMATTNSNRVEYKPKYFDFLSRLPIPIMHSEVGPKPSPGEFFLCQAVMCWEDKRYPIGLIPLSLADRTKAVKHAGRVSKLKLKLPVAFSTITPRLNPNSAEFIEILTVQDENRVEGNVSYSYCEVNDIQVSSHDHTKDNLQRNDDIEYWIAPSLGSMAVGVKILPKMQFQQVGYFLFVLLLSMLINFTVAV